MRSLRTIILQVRTVNCSDTFLQVTCLDETKRQRFLEPPEALRALILSIFSTMGSLLWTLLLLLIFVLYLQLYVHTVPCLRRACCGICAIRPGAQPLRPKVGDRPLPLHDHCQYDQYDIQHDNPQCHTQVPGGVASFLQCHGRCPGAF